MDDVCRDIYEKLSAVQWLLRRMQMLRHTEYGPFSEIHYGQGRVLAFLKIQPEVATRDLAYLLGIRQQSLNELLNRLEQGGYVERKPSDKDRRVMIVHLTDKGKELRQPENDWRSVFGCLADEELSALSRYLDRIIDSLEEQAALLFEEDMSVWMEQARGRMGDEGFEEAVRRSGLVGGGLKMFRRNRRENGDLGFGCDVRGPAPKDLPGAERFAPDYDGPLPEGRGRFPWQRRKEKEGDDAKA